MHNLLIEKFNLDPVSIDVERSGLNITYKVANHGTLKKQPFRDAFRIKKFTHPLIDHLKQDTIDSYYFFEKVFNQSLSQNYNKRKFPTKIDEISEEITFNFVTATHVETVYTIKLMAKQTDGHTDCITVHYTISDIEPTRCTFEFFMIPNSGVHKHIDKALEFNVETPYYKGKYGLILAYIYEHFFEKVEETFEDIDKFVYNIDDNLDVLLMQIF